MSTALQPALAIVPYIRERDRGAALYDAWQIVEASGDAHQLFWNTPEPEPLRGDLAFFTSYFTGPGRQLFLLGQDAQPIGLAWAEDIQEGHHCYVSLFVCPAHRGKTGLEAARLVATTLFDVYALQRLFIATPWRPAKMLGLTLGFKPIGRLPKHAVYWGHRYDVSILQLERGRAWEA